MGYTLNPFTGQLDDAGSASTATSPLPGTITRTGDYISEVEIIGGATFTVTRNGSGYITSIDNGTYVWTYTRNGNNQITSWAIS